MITTAHTHPDTFQTPSHYPILANIMRLQK
jgi:hypothetical protein